MPGYVGLVVWILGWIALTPATAAAQTPATIAEQLTTQERIQRSTWWPTSGKAPRADYAGTTACSQCHGSIVKSQGQHAMAKASVHAADSNILQGHASQTFQVDGYAYKISGEPGSPFSYSVTDPTQTVSHPITWAFGAGRVGQSYLSEEGGAFHEVRFSFFDALGLFGTTPNQSPQPALTMNKASGRLLSGGEAERCFGCHTAASRTAGHFEPDKAIPGVSCENCHGPGAKHVAMMKAGDFDNGRAAIVNPGSLKPVGLVDFCGACHTTWWDAKNIAATGVATVRFQPYRLESSRCWGKGDARITCVACHNPHQQLVKETASYDNRCLSCHSTAAGAKLTADHPGAACPVAKQDCASCHMPKYEVPDMHYKYTDHRIRVVKAGESYPE